jgi:MscS family membrane protein
MSENIHLFKVAISIAVTFAFTWFCWRLIKKFEKKYSSIKMVSTNPTTAQGIAYLLKIALFSLTALAVLQFLGIPLSGIIAFGGFGGIAVGFAAKDLMANIFGGLMIFFDRQFQIGDWICSPDKEIEGTVEHIGWRVTQIRTLDKRPLFVPNSLFSTIVLQNASRMSNRRIKETISLNYEEVSKVEAIVSDIEKIVKNHPDIDKNSTCFVNLVDLSPDSLKIMIYAFTKSIDVIEFHAIKQDIFLKSLNVLQNHNSKIAYPMRLVQLIETKNQFLLKETSNNP